MIFLKKSDWKPTLSDQKMGKKMQVRACPSNPLYSVSTKYAWPIGRIVPAWSNLVMGNADLIGPRHGTDEERVVPYSSVGRSLSLNMIRLV
jgi:hypothetical protein